MKKLTLTTLREVESESRKVTKACREKETRRRKEPKKEYPKIAKKVAAAMAKTSICGSYRKDICEIVEAIIGTPLPPSVKADSELKSFFVKHAVVVCTSNPNSHNYGRKPLLLLGRNNYNNLIISGRRGNRLPSSLKTHSPIRYATNEEVTVYFKAIRQLVKDKKSVEYFG